MPKKAWGMFVRYLLRYSHRVAIANCRLIAFDQQGVTRGGKTAHQKSHTNLVRLTPSPKEWPTGDELSRTSHLAKLDKLLMISRISCSQPSPF